MRGYNDNFDMTPANRPESDIARGGLVSALVALSMLLIMIVGVFVLSGGVGDYAGEPETMRPAAVSVAN